MRRCFVCGRKLGKTPYVADTHEDQTVYVGSECRKLVHDAGQNGLKVGPGANGLRLYVLTPERQAYFVAKFGKAFVN